MSTKKFKFNDYKLVTLFHVTELEVEAENLDEAKEKLLDYYDKGGEPSLNDETKNIKVNTIRTTPYNPLGHENLSNVTISLSDNTYTNFGEFKPLK